MKKKVNKSKQNPSLLAIDESEVYRLSVAWTESLVKQISAKLEKLDNKKDRDTLLLATLNMLIFAKNRLIVMQKLEKYKEKLNKT